MSLKRDRDPTMISDAAYDTAKTLGELWLQKRPQSIEDDDDDDDKSTSSLESPLSSHNTFGRLAQSVHQNKTSPLLQQVPQNNVDIPQLCVKIKSGRYTSDTINITHAHPTREHLDLLSNALVNNQSITTLRVTHCSLWSTDARVLTYFLVRNRSLRLLDLSHNVITASGARAIAENLVGNTSIRHIFLSANSIGNEGARAFWHLLKGNDLKTMIANGSSGRASVTTMMSDKQRQQEERRSGPPECQLRTIGIDENGINDMKLLDSIVSLTQQKLPGSWHNKVKRIHDEKMNVVNEVRRLKEMLSQQEQTLLRYRDKVSQNVRHEVEGGNKGGGRRRKKGRRWKNKSGGKKRK